MTVFQYDNTLDGLLTAVFHAYARRQFPDILAVEGEPLPLFADDVFRVCTDPALADRVWKGLERKVKHREMLAAVSVSWLSELPGIGTILFRYIRKLFDYTGNFSFNLGDPDVLQVNKIWRKVNKERSYVIQFLRFQKAADGIYFAAVKPLYNVLPLTLPHLTDRFADQTWLVYDTKRCYGYYYNGKGPEEIRFAGKPGHLAAGKLDASAASADEQAFQEMWQAYFRSTAIKERYNPRLQRQNLPARFWPYLVEMY